MKDTSKSQKKESAKVNNGLERRKSLNFLFFEINDPRNITILYLSKRKTLYLG